MEANWAEEDSSDAHILQHSPTLTPGTADLQNLKGKVVKMRHNLGELGENCEPREKTGRCKTGFPWKIRRAGKEPLSHE